MTPEVQPGPPALVACPQCGYEIGPEVRVCPECGVPVTDDTFRQAALRRRLREGLADSCWRLLAFQGAAVLVLGTLAGLVARSAPAALTAAVAVGAVCGLGWVLGAVGAAIARSGERGLHAALWQRHALLLHVPWAAAPGFAIVLLVFVALHRLAGLPEQAVGLAGIVLGLLWFVLGIVALSAWSGRWVDDARAIGVWPSRQVDAAVLLAMVQFLASGVLGFVLAAGAAVLLARLLP